MTSPNSDLEGTESSANSSLPIARILLGIGVLAALLYLGRSAGGYIPVFADWVAGLGALGPIVFILGYAIAVVAFSVVVCSVAFWAMLKYRRILLETYPIDEKAQDFSLV